MRVMTQAGKTSDLWVITEGGAVFSITQRRTGRQFHIIISLKKIKASGEMMTPLREAFEKYMFTNPLDYFTISSMTPEDLKKWRAENGYTQTTLAEALSVISITVSRWERGERSIPAFLHLALDALECRNKEVRKREGIKKMEKEEDRA